MKILGIAGSTRKEDQSGVYKLVEATLKATNMDYELVHLRGKKIGGCIACLGCVEDNVCVLKDDMAELREKIVEADAYVIGAPNYYSTMNAITHALLERFYQFRHREGDTLWGKLGVAVGVGGSSGAVCTTEIERFFMYNFIETVAKVDGQHAASCFICGYGETCGVGAVRMLLGEGVKITAENTPSVAKNPALMEEAKNAGVALAARLMDNHDRRAVTERMQATLMAEFAKTT
ncbi:MAG: flavodoxin family protein [Deltaproteobacteria bacterium]|nr:MAG: flavodoxin family protein [Deltaproteobacteria bacterium]